MTRLEQVIAGLGGIAPTWALLAEGFDPELLAIGSRYGYLVKVRKGWWATMDTPPLVIEARKGGGRLTCVSALEHYGILELSAASSDVHVYVRHGSSRLRSTRDLDVTTVVHWARARAGGDFGAVSVASARRQANECRNLGARAIPLESVYAC